jgi:hypothetical protein
MLSIVKSSVNTTLGLTEKKVGQIRQMVRDLNSAQPRAQSDDFIGPEEVKEVKKEIIEPSPKNSGC